VRVLLYDTGVIHRKISEAIPRMCAAVGASLEITRDMARINTEGYDLLITPCQHIDPGQLPQNTCLLMGPQLYVLPSGPTVGPYCAEYEHRVAQTCLSQWVKELYLEHVPSLRYPLEPMPTGVDTVRFCPGRGARESVILYIKHRSPANIGAAREALASAGIAYREFAYGSYDENVYIAALQTAKFMVVVDAHESQGYALQEAMSCGVPLLVWDVRSMYEEYNENSQVYHNNGKQMHATSVPWWSQECGLRIHSAEDLPAALTAMCATWQEFRSRDYVVSNLSDEACMRRWLAYFHLK